MSEVLTTNADRPAPPAPEVRLVQVRANGQLLCMIAEGAALQLVDRAWAIWRGVGSRKHLELTDAAPLSNLRPALSRGTTRPARAAGRPLPNGTQSKYLPNQRLGDSRSTREHTLPREF